MHKAPQLINCLERLAGTLSLGRHAGRNLLLFQLNKLFLEFFKLSLHTFDSHGGYFLAEAINCFSLTSSLIIDLRWLKLVISEDLITIFLEVSEDSKGFLGTNRLIYDINTLDKVAVVRLLSS